MVKMTKKTLKKTARPTAKVKARKPARDTSPPPPEEVNACLKWLRATYPDTKSFLDHENAYQLLAAVILSAQCTDARVNLTTPALFKRFPDAKAMAAAKPAEIEKLVQSCGFFRMKAKALKAMSQSLLDNFGGEVPNSIEKLVTLAGVGRKTASVILSQAFDLPAIAVDTHVARVSQRLGWAHHPNPEKIEIELKACVPQENWSEINTLMILHGRGLCNARKPLCGECGIRAYCEYFQSLARDPG